MQRPFFVLSVFGPKMADFVEDRSISVVAIFDNRMGEDI
ncbi:hypothetical protein BSLA_02f0358 [Burkholderia stabilis]|nr:hypothetical protein BSLA_02f0358 [Burkholderia stabilis]